MSLVTRGWGHTRPRVVMSPYTVFYPSANRLDASVPKKFPDSTFEGWTGSQGSDTPKLDTRVRHAGCRTSRRVGGHQEYLRGFPAAGRPPK